MRIVFMGTPEFAVPSLRVLAGRHEVTLVVTRPDAVRGRGRRLEPSSVKAAAIELGIAVCETRRMTPEVVERLRVDEPDVICVAAYGALLPDAVLDLPKYGCINVHASLLPHGRGAAPIQRAVLEGDAELGVSIMRLVQAMDAGPYCRQASIPADGKPCGQLMDELAHIGAAELLGALDDIEAGTVVWTAQDDSQATYVAKVTKQELLLDPADDAATNVRRVQASLDAAPARCIVAGRGVRALEATLAKEAVGAGEVMVRKGRVLLGCAQGTIELLQVKPDGKRAMDARSWASGLRGDDLSWERA